MKILGVEHVQLAMPPAAEDTARSFYAGVLGMCERPKPEHLAKRGGVWFEHTNVKIHLGVEADFRPARKAHPAFLVDDLKELVNTCKKAGHDVIKDEPLAGYERIYVFDPFGNRLEFLEQVASQTEG